MLLGLVVLVVALVVALGVVALVGAVAFGVVVLGE